jgi:hypothetical protein
MKLTETPQTVTWLRLTMLLSDYPSSLTGGECEILRPLFPIAPPAREGDTGSIPAATSPTA